MIGPSHIIDLTETTDMAVDDNSSTIPVIDLTDQAEMEEEDDDTVSVVFVEEEYYPGDSVMPPIRREPRVREQNQLPQTPEAMGAAITPPPLVRQNNVGLTAGPAEAPAPDAFYLERYRTFCEEHQESFFYELAGASTVCEGCMKEFEDLTDNIIQFLSLSGEDARIVDHLRELTERASRIAWELQDAKHLYNAVYRSIEAERTSPPRDLEASLDTLRLRTVCGAKLFEYLLQARCLFERAHEVDLFGIVPEWDDELVAIEMKLNQM